MAAFTWENFDNTFLKKVIYSPDTPENVRPIFPTEEKEDLVCSMNLICDYPDKSFVVRYRDVIEENLFHNYSDIFKEVCSTVGINMYDSINALYTLRLKPLTVSLISAYINALLKTGGCDVMITQSSKFRYTIKLDMAKTPSEDIPLYDYQKDAVSALTEHFVKKDNKKGMLIMPTGSGKSRTASYFLIREMISLGYQVLWIVHRHMLIDQAAECFYRFAGLSKLSDPDIKNYRISCISGEHQSIRAIAKKDNIIIGSIQSLCRNHNHLRRITSPKLFIVIDEAHHTFARSYRETLKYLFKYRPDAKLLGITATPVRSSEGASAELLKLFDNNIITFRIGAVKKIYHLIGFENIENAFDMLLASYLLNPLKSDISISDVASKYLNIHIPDEAEVFGKMKISEAVLINIDAFARYAAYRSYVLFKTKEEVYSELTAAGMKELYEKIEFPLAGVLYDMEREGITVDRQELKNYGGSLTGRIDELEKLIYEQAGTEFNINSPKQLGEILFEKMGLPGGKKTKSGFSTAADVLEKLAQEYPIVNDILEYRGLTKLKSTYAEGLAQNIKEDGKIHTTFNQTITATGRISSTEPNLQNIPMRMELGRKIRKCFVPKEGYVFLDADYSQIELRILAHMADDEDLLEGLNCVF